MIASFSFGRQLKLSMGRQSSKHSTSNMVSKSSIIVLVMNLSLSWACSTLPTPNGTPTPLPCVFPFKYRGLKFDKCTPEFDQNKKPWCSVKVNSEGDHLSGAGLWGHCDLTTCQDESLRRQNNSEVENVSCKTLAVNSPTVQDCVFPFTFEGIVFHTCTSIFDRDDRLWCSIKTDNSGNHISGNWDYCQCSENDASTNQDRAINIDSNPLETDKSDSTCATNIIFNNAFPQDGDYLPDLMDCGSNDAAAFVVGGEDARPGEFPFAAAIGYKTDTPSGERVVYRCGGSLINRRYVLTAAHCLPEGSNYYEVKLGDTDFKEDCDCLPAFRGKTLCMPKPQRILIESVVKHEQYFGPQDKYKNDIALIRLAQPAQITQGVRPICLPINENKLKEAFDISNLIDGLVSDITDTIIIGWGKVTIQDKFDSSQSNVQTSVLQKADIPVRPFSHCERTHRGEQIDNESQFCAGIRGRDVCSGDSGGPLFKRGPNSMMIQFGIVSYGDRRCARARPAVYTRVTKFVPWIQANLKK
ncbi:phenoloxidase-activating factor 3-like isoform X1 [Tigriopus californicus]|uniref:phenoloxidase-activating factor 3-like isoform X1 n=2 Tax=Tigriopus californicus TaxID=6832 RepID=UPI0027DA8982|nr:phenoloxidase-activating factor 3-like isoform X1 [Tigriopus californicus]